jgi:S-(hydroxymethyl)glutathione dehydrogenase/alcohol dehydrogenase
MVRAAVLYKANERMAVKELVQSGPKAGEVRVRMGAAGVCASDHHVMLGQTNFPMPIVLGHEGAGTVAEIGPNVTSVKPGDRCILSFVPSCGFCHSCRSGMGQLCDTNRLTGTRQYDGTFRLKDERGDDVHQFAKLGVFADEIVVPQQACYVIPDDVPLEVAALVGCSVTTGVGGVINQPAIRAGMTVAVFGVGGVGLNAIQGARLLNATRIIAVDVQDHKLEFAYRFGATDVINSRSQDPAKAISEMTGGGVDFAFDTFGGAITTEQMMASVRKGGTGVLVGLAPEGVTAGINMIDLVRNQKTLVGSYYGSASPHETFGKLLDFWRRGTLEVESLVTRTHELAEINEAYDALARGDDGRGILVFA